MKFQILTEKLPEWEAIATGHTHVALCLPPSWVSGPIRILGDSKEHALERVTDFIQDRLDNLKSKGDFVEVDLEPKRKSSTNKWY